jgi:hypothetical protein
MNAREKSIGTNMASPPQIICFPMERCSDHRITVEVTPEVNVQLVSFWFMDDLKIPKRLRTEESVLSDSRYI